MDIKIAGHTRIKDGTVHKDGHLLYNDSPATFDQFSESVYNHFKIAYSKFHKMDNLSKLGLLTSDILLNFNDLYKTSDPESTGVILSNNNSSLDTDVKYYNMVKQGVASPAVFVYSLPNIVIGEICIRNGIKGENTFFISDSYDIPAQVEYINNLFDNKLIDTCICGWVELMEENYDAFLYLATSKGKLPHQPTHTIENIQHLYQPK